MADVKHIEINETTYDIRDEKAARKGMYIGTCTTAAATAAKVATVDTFPVDSNGKPLVGTIVGVKFSATNTYKTEGTTMTLDVNSTGAYPIYYNNAAIVSTTSANTLCCGYKNRYIYYIYDNNGGDKWVWLTASYDTNSTYSAMTQAEVDAGTGTTGRTLTPARLRDNFYTEGEVDTLLGAKANSADLATVATSGSYNDLSDKPTIPSTSGLASETYVNGKIPFIVELTASVVNEQVSVSTSTTFAQIKAAHDAGRVVIARVGGQTDFLLTNILSDEATFSIVSKEAHASTQYLATLRCTDQDVWTVTTSPFADVAFSGSYNDLSNKPTIPNLADAKPLIVNVTRSGSGDNITYSADTTVIDINNAVKAGRAVVAKILNSYYQLHYCAEVSENTEIEGDFFAASADEAPVIVTTLSFYSYRDTTSDPWEDSWELNFLTEATPDWNITNQYTRGFIKNKPTIPTVDSSLTGSSQTNPVQGGAIYSALEGKQDKDFIVTITRSGTYPNYTYTANKTAVQIDTAYKAGKNIIVRLNGSNYYLGDNASTYDGTDGEIDYYFYRVDAANSYLVEFNLYAYYESGVLDTETWNRSDVEVASTSDLSSYVPTTRKVNNKALSSDITLTASDVGALPSNTAIPSVVNNLTTTTTGSALDATQGKALKDTVDTKADKVTVVTVSTTGAVTQALSPNVFYDFTGSPTSLTVSLVSGTGLCIYAGKFTAGTGFSDFTLPSGVAVADGAPTIEAGSTYEFSIMENLMLLAKEGS